MLETHTQMERRDEEEAERITYGTFIPKPTVTFTIVAFRYDSHRSVLYTSCDTPRDVAKLVEGALEHQKADVISIRRVYEQRPLPK